MPAPQSVNYVKILGLFGSGLLSGGNLYVSVFAVPVILSYSQIPSHVLHAQWLKMYNTGKVTAPPISLLTAAAFGYVSIYSGDDWESILFAAAAISTLGIVPFTLLGMRKNLAALLDERKTWTDLDRRSLRELLENWRSLNFVRSGLLIVGFGTALVASLS